MLFIALGLLRNSIINTRTVVLIVTYQCNSKMNIHFFNPSSVAFVSGIGLFNVLRTVCLTSCKRFKIVVNGHVFCKTSEWAQHNISFRRSLIWKLCLSHCCCFSLYIMCCVYLSWDWYNGHTISSAPLSNLVQNCILVCQTVCNTTIKMNLYKTEFFLGGDEEQPVRL